MTETSYYKVYKRPFSFLTYPSSILVLTDAKLKSTLLNTGVDPIKEI